MNAPVNLQRSVTEKSNPDRGPIKHQKGPFLTKRGYRVPKKTL